jgi:phosphopantothenoylcysteine decarboxylase/phosphopantothenate--cysteine ligase
MSRANPIRLLITAGATQEHIDGVRFIGNRSSGQLGATLALFSAIRGYEVTLLLGANSVKQTAHPRLITVPFSSTRDLQAKLLELWPTHRILIMAAAVADFTPKSGQIEGKIRRGESPQLDLIPTEDLVSGLASNAREDQRILAFALEHTDNLPASALEKLERKKVDAIVANPLATMDANTISAEIYCKDGRRLAPAPDLQKPEFANWLIEHLDEILTIT